MRIDVHGAPILSKSFSYCELSTIQGHNPISRMSIHLPPPKPLLQKSGSTLAEESALQKELCIEGRYADRNFRSNYNRMVGQQIQEELSRITRRSEENEIWEAAFVQIMLSPEISRHRQHAG